jgi:P4 family phage/plasmid primase-like protien
MSEPAMERIAGAGGPGFEEEMYVAKFLRRVTLRTSGTDWFVYNGRSWDSIESDKYHPQVKRLLPRGMRSVKNIVAVIGGAQSDRQLEPGEEFASATVLDREKREVYVNCQNGVLRVGAESVALIPHGSPDIKNHFAGCLSAEWRGEYLDEMTPLFGRVVCEALPDEGDRALQHWFAGYLLYPGCEHEVCLINYGEGGTSKSTISDAVMAVIGGSPLKAVLSLAQLCAEGQGAYSLPALKPALVNMGTELDTVDIKDSSNLKRIVSGEPIEVRSIYGKPYPMTSTVKLWFNSNSIPRFKNGTDAELRRVRFLRFMVKVAEESKDRDLKAKLAEERHGIFSWMVQSLQYLLKGVPCPEGGRHSREIKVRFALANDPVKAFGEECCVFGPEEEEPREAIFAAFAEFMASWGFAPKRKDDLFRRFYERYPQVRPVRKRVKKDSEERVIWLKGVSLAAIKTEAIKA